MIGKFRRLGMVAALLVPRAAVVAPTSKTARVKLRRETLLVGIMACVQARSNKMYQVCSHRH